MDTILQLERVVTGSVDMGQNVIFDTTVVSSGNISYDNVTGIITIQQPGRYQFNWWVAAQASELEQGTIFFLTTSQGDSIAGNSPQRNGEVVGIAVIEVAAAPVTVSLQNQGGTVFYASGIPVQASLTVSGTEQSGEGVLGTMVPFSSGILIPLTTTSQGIADLGSLVGFGYSLSAMLVGGQLSEIDDYMSFVVPKESILTNLFAFFNTKAPEDFDSAVVEVVAQVYSAGLSDVIFSPIPEARLVLSPSLTGAVPEATNLWLDSSNLSIPIAKGTRLTLLYYCQISSGPVSEIMVQGCAAAGMYLLPLE